MVNGWRQQGKNNRAKGKCWRQKPFILCSYSSIDSLRWPFLFFSFFLQFFPTKQPDSRLLTKRPPKYHRLLFIRNLLPYLISSYTWLILDNQLSVVYMPKNEVACMGNSQQKKNGFNAIGRRSKITTWKTWNRARSGPKFEESIRRGKSLLACSEIFIILHIILSLL